MTEEEKFNVYIDETLQIDRNDATQAQRIHDMHGAWMMRANEPLPMPTGWKEVARHLYQRLDLGDLPESPSLATTALDSTIDMFKGAIGQANVQVQSLASRDQIIQQQSNILDAFAAVLKLEQGKLYMDMVPMLQAVVAKAEEPRPQLVGENNTPVQ